MTRLHQLAETIRDGRYEVDAEATAGAIIARLLGSRPRSERPAAA